ncbi:hypothetical protein ACHHYP_09411 [Achlya hypogyna]|uniref:Nucleoplasmin-like domain-containing protein n=1 Tax=Achlya hypogyna TaxID=1202772 RepID=A0A1V9YNB2_ACHHY|nr:hypothetical protein ACHHYP_09411 [Achlya hypogyna]
MVHFFGGVVSEGKPLAVHVPEAMVLTLATATLTTGSTATVFVETTGVDNQLVKVALCSLRAKTADMTKLDIVFGATKTKLTVVGDATVHLAGYYQPGPPEELPDHADAIERLTVDDLQELIQKAAARLANNDALESPKASKKRPRQESPKSAPEPEPSDDEDDTEVPNKAPAIAQKPAAPGVPHEDGAKRKKKKKNKRNKHVLSTPN